MEMKPHCGQSRQLLLVTSSCLRCVWLRQLLFWWGGQRRSWAMGFGEDLWCPQAHAAVVRLLDSELHLMEVMKKWMGQRAKSEREFSAQLHHMTSIVEKMDRSQHGAGPDYISQLNKVRGSTSTAPQPLQNEKAGSAEERKSCWKQSRPRKRNGDLCDKDIKTI